MNSPLNEILRVEHLVKEFPISRSHDVVHAVNDVSFSLHSSETVGLVGESGSGKTTVGRCLLRLIQATSGRILFKGRDTSRMTERQFRREVRPRIQMVFQDPYESLNPRFTIREILEENLILQVKQPRSERAARVTELLELVRLPRRVATAYPHELTGGEQQRVSIGRAISTGPDLVVLDEPTSALDISVRSEIIRLLRELQAETHVSLLFISHDLTAVKELSHRVMIMYLGEIVEVASTESIFNEQFHPYSMALLASVLFPDPDAPHGTSNLAGEIPSPVHPPSGCHLHPRCPFAIDICTSQKARLEEIRAGRLSACHRAYEFIQAGPGHDIATRSASG